MKNEDDGVRIEEGLPCYVNGATVLVTPMEIIMDFTSTDGSIQANKVRIIMAPEMGKGLVELLTAALNKFEQDHGKIRDIKKIWGNRPGVSRVTPAGSTGVQ